MTQDYSKYEDFFSFLQHTERFAKLCCSQGYCGLRGEDWKSLQKAMYILEKYHQIDPVQAILSESIYFIQGKMGFKGELILSLIYNKGNKVEVVENTGQKCILKGIRKNGDSMLCAYTMEQAQQAGLLNKGLVWRHHPQALLYWRCVAKLAKRFFSDVMLGVAPDVVVEPTTFFLEAEPEPKAVAYEKQQSLSEESEIQIMQRLSELRKEPNDPGNKLQKALQKVTEQGCEDFSLIQDFDKTLIKLWDQGDLL